MPRPVASRKGLRVTALLLVFALLSVCLRTALGASPVYLLRLLYGNTDQDSYLATALWNGLSAALSARNYTTANNQTITILEKTSSEDASNPVPIVQRVLAAYPSLLAVLSPFSAPGTKALLSSTVLTDNNLVLFAPFIYASSLRVWDDRLYYTRAEPEAELLLLLNYALNTLRVRRLGFMYLTNSLIGDDEYAQTVSLLEKAGRDAPALYAVALDNTASLNQTAFDAMANADMQAIIVFSTSTKQTIDFVRACLTDSRTSSAVLLGPSMVIALMQEQYRLLVAAGTVTYADNKVVNAISNVLPNADSFAHVKLFQTEMTAYINSGVSDYTDSSYYLTNVTVGAAMLSGWIGGKTLLTALSRSTWTTSAADFQTGIFWQNRYEIGNDFVLGDFGGPCSADAVQQGAVCSCNQGGHTTYLATVQSRSVVNSIYTMTYPTSQCYAAGSFIENPLNFVILNFTDASQMVTAANTLALLTTVSAPSPSKTSLTFNTATLNTVIDSTTAQATLDAYLATHFASVIRGPFLSDMNTSLMVLEPFYSKATTRILQRNVLTLRPTVEQYFYIIMENYKTLGVDSMNIVMRGYNSAEIALVRKYAIKTADTFDAKNPTITTLTDTGDLNEALSFSGLSCLMGLVSGDAATLVIFLRAHSNARIFLGAQDFYMFYDEIIAAFDDATASVQERLLFLTNLPLWTDTSASAHASSVALSIYHELAPTPYTPLGLEMFVMTWFLESITTNLGVVNSTTLVDFVYHIGIVAANDIVLGQFAWDCPDESAPTCVQQNYGARNIAALSLRGVLSPSSVSATIPATTPSMTYRPRSTASGLTKGQLAGVIVGSVVGGLLVIALIVFLTHYCAGGSRNNNIAPKNMEDPVTIIFTDIESSTALWAALPQLMPDAVATHHRVVRSVLKRQKCYEVKTIGDSFMIACKDAFSAIKVATEIQTKLLKFDWKTTEIDEAYRRFELRRVKDTSDRAPTAELSREVYEAMWHGLRVRMGIHTGLSDIRRDEVTRGYDYYGDTSNMAARTEAIANGGQVIMTEATWWALSSEERAGLNFRKMGPQGLRGVPYAVDMYQLNPILGRQFANLRTEIEANIPDDDEVSRPASVEAEELLSTPSELSGPANAVAYVLASCFSTYPPAQRARELQPLLSKWSVPVSPRPRGVSEDDHCQSLINRLAAKVAHVTQARFVQSVDGMDSHLANMRGPGPSWVRVNRNLRNSDPAFSRTTPSGTTGAITSPLAESVVSPLVRVEDGEDEHNCNNRTATPQPPPAHDDQRVFERSTLESTMVNPFERSRVVSTTVISMEAVQRLMQGCVMPRKSQSSAVNPARQSHSDQR